MGKNCNKNSHVHGFNPDREAARIRVTIVFLLREKLGQLTNPENLRNPQPLTRLDVLQFLHAVLRKPTGESENER